MNIFFPPNQGTTCSSTNHYFHKVIPKVPEGDA